MKNNSGVRQIQQSAYDQLFQTTYTLVAASSGIRDEHILQASVHGFLSQQLTKATPTELLQRFKGKAGRTILLGLFLTSLAVTPAQAKRPTMVNVSGTAQDPAANLILPTSNLTPIGLACGDLDADGDLDLLLSQNAGFYNSTIVNNGTAFIGNFNSFALTLGGMTSTNQNERALVDMNGDGKLDAVALFANSAVLQPNISSVGMALFSSSAGSLFGIVASNLTVADMDGDGDYDIVTSNSLGTNFGWTANNGSALGFSFNTSTSTALLGITNTLMALPYARNIMALEAADLDGDGDHDLLVGLDFTGNINILYPTGKLYFVENIGTTTSPSFQVDTNPIFQAPVSYFQSMDVTAGDFDSDGDIDLVIAHNDKNGAGIQNMGFSFLDNQTPPGPPNNAPTVPVLLSPDDGAVVPGPNLTVSWGPATDLDGDALTYTASLCQDVGMDIGCIHQSPAGLAFLQVTKNQPPAPKGGWIHSWLPFDKVALAAESGELPQGQNSAGWWLMAMLGILLGASFSKYTRKQWVYAAIVLVFGVAACSPPPTDSGSQGLSSTFSNLAPGTYYWKVSVTDGTDSVTTSIRSVNVQ